MSGAKDPKDSEDELAGTEQPFVSHLIELRDRLIRVALAIGLAFGVLCLWPGIGAMYDLVAAPMTANLPPGTKLIATNVFSPFMVPLKITMMAGFLIVLPYVLYQLWAFVAPGLYSHEKKLVLPLVVSSTILFFAGVAFCYFIVIPGLTKFIVAVTPTSVNAAPDIEQYFGTVLSLFLVFGIAFEVPIAVVVLARLNIVTIEQLKSFRGYFVVVAFIVAAVVTPPDVVSQLALAIPMCILYELGIWSAKLFIKHTQAPQAEGEKAS
jgi:sec-independent protein translocase protein TatC